MMYECRREAFETEARRSSSAVRPTEAYGQFLEEAEREQALPGERIGRRSRYS
jgi:hypothetical protein